MNLLITMNLLIAAVSTLSLLPVQARPSHTGPEGEHAAHFSVRGLGLAATDAELGGTIAAFGVVEPSEAKDLNGDGDRFDVVAHINDGRTGHTTNLGLALPTGERAIDTDGLVVVLLVDEANQGADLNGDGDLEDEVVHAFLPATDRSIDLGLAAPKSVGLPWTEEVEGVVNGSFVFLVDEGQQGVDLNHDGDLEDQVLHRFDHGTRRAENLALACAFNEVAAVDGTDSRDDSIWMVWVDESAQGGTDLNGDGDAIDVLLFLVDAHGRAVNTALTELPFGGRFRAAKRLAVALTFEGFGAGDLNGDGDALDIVPYSLDLREGLEHARIRNLGIAVVQGWPNSVDRGWAALWVSELGENGTDFNGDGDTSDVVLFAFDLEAGVALSTRLAASFAHPVAIVPRPFRDTESPRSHSSRAHRVSFVFEVDELAQAESDLNGDGDTADRVMHLFDPDTGSVTNLELATADWAATRSGTRVGNGIALVIAREADQGHSDLNGDGDASDLVVHIVNAIEGTVENTGLALASFTYPPWRVGPSQVIGSTAYFLLSEGAQGGQDLNGNGVVIDNLLYAYDARCRTSAWLGLAGRPGTPSKRMPRSGSRLSIVVPEASNRSSLNGDEDLLDEVPFLVERLPDTPRPSEATGGSARPVTCRFAGRSGE